MSHLSTDWIKVSSPAAHVLIVELARKPVNAFNEKLWLEYSNIFERIPEETEDTRVVIVTSASPKVFTAGIDPAELGSAGANGGDSARHALRLRRHVKRFQHAIGASERCPVPVIAAVNGVCIGLGMDLISACDIRYASSDALFSIKESEVGLAADIGTLAYLPHITSNESFARELAYTASNFDSETAEKIGLVSKVVQGGRDAVISAAIDLAKKIAANSPVAIAGTKRLLIHSRDHSVEENLDYTASWSAAMLQTEDLQMASKAALSKPKVVPTFQPIRSPKSKL